MPCCTRDEGRPLGLGLQGQGPNHRQLRGHNGPGGERARKRRDVSRQVCAEKTNVSEPSSTCRNEKDVVESGLQSLARERAWEVPADGPGDDRHQDGVIFAQALVWNVGTFGLDAKGELQVAGP